MANLIYICDTLATLVTQPHWPCRGDPSLRKNTINGPQKIITCFWEYFKVCGNNMAHKSKVADTPLSFTLHTHYTQLKCVTAFITTFFITINNGLAF